VTARPAVARPPGPGEREDQQGHQPDRKARRDYGHAQRLGVAAEAAVQQMRSGAGDHRSPARHDHYRTQHRQGDEEPPLPRGGGIRAHRSTIASPFAPRKPYGQVRPSRLP
jgi:hypothetical protein